MFKSVDINSIKEYFLYHLLFDVLNVGFANEIIHIYTNKETKETVTINVQSIIYILAFLKERFPDTTKVKMYAFQVFTIPNVYSIKCDYVTSQIYISVRTDKSELPTAFSVNLANNIAKDHGFTLFVEDYYSGDLF
jgi:hypothetical protein